MASIVPEGTVVYGMQLPIHTLTLTLREPWELDATVADLVALAQQAERTGHAFIGITDHIAIPDNDYAKHMTTTWYDTVATLAFLAAHTSTVRLLSSVLVAAYRHPLQTAKAFGTLDHLSGGRAILGVGAGHVEAEFEALGVDFHQRGKLLDETLTAIRGAFADTYVSFAGDHYRYERVGVAPAPVHGELPIWVGGLGKAAWRRAGRFGDGYIPMGNTVEQYPEIIATMRESAEAAGRGDVRFDVGGGAGFLYIGEPTWDLGAWPHITGSPHQIADAFRPLIDVGVNVLQLRFRSRSHAELMDQMEAFGTDVAPLLT